MEEQRNDDTVWLIDAFTGEKGDVPLELIAEQECKEVVYSLIEDYISEKSREEGAV